MKKNTKKVVGKSMSKNMSSKKGKGKMNMGKKIAIGAGVVALGTGAYMFLGPNGKNNRKKAQVLINKAKVNAVKAGNKVMKSRADVERMGKEVKREWAKILSGAKAVSKPALRRIKSSTTKSAKKIVKAVKKVNR